MSVAMLYGRHFNWTLLSVIHLSVFCFDSCKNPENVIENKMAYIAV